MQSRWQLLSSVIVTKSDYVLVKLYILTLKYGFHVFFICHEIFFFVFFSHAKIFFRKNLSLAGEGSIKNKQIEDLWDSELT